MPCIGRRILNHCTTREAPHLLKRLEIAAAGCSFISPSAPWEEAQSGAGFSLLAVNHFVWSLRGPNRSCLLTPFSYAWQGILVVGRDVPIPEQRTFISPFPT